MDEIKGVLTSPVWWISVVVAGILINITASYLRTVLDARLSRMSRRWRVKSQQRAGKRDHRIESLANDTHAQLIESHCSTRRLLMSLLFFAIGLYVMVAGILIKLDILANLPLILVVASYLLMSFMYFMGYLTFNQSRKLTLEIHDALSRSVKGEAPPTSVLGVDNED